MYRLRIGGEMILGNETESVDDFFSLLLETKQAVTLSLVADSLYKHRR